MFLFWLHKREPNPTYATYLSHRLSNNGSVYQCLKSKVQLSSFDMSKLHKSKLPAPVQKTTIKLDPSIVSHGHNIARWCLPSVGLISPNFFVVPITNCDRTYVHKLHQQTWAPHMISQRIFLIVLINNVGPP